MFARSAFSRSCHYGIIKLRTDLVNSGSSTPVEDDLVNLDRLLDRQGNESFLNLTLTYIHDHVLLLRLTVFVHNYIILQDLDFSPARAFVTQAGCNSW